MKNHLDKQVFLVLLLQYNLSSKEDVMRYICALCGYEYKVSKGDPEGNIEKGTEFEDIPEDWVCPLCGASKEDFEILSDDAI